MDKPQWLSSRDLNSFKWMVLPCLMSILYNETIFTTAYTSVTVVNRVCSEDHRFIVCGIVNRNGRHCKFSKVRALYKCNFSNGIVRAHYKSILITASTQYDRNDNDHHLQILSNQDISSAIIASWSTQTLLSALDERNIRYD
jgi:hypothetical protein